MCLILFHITNIFDRKSTIAWNLSAWNDVSGSNVLKVHRNFRKYIIFVLQTILLPRNNAQLTNLYVIVAKEKRNFWWGWSHKVKEWASLGRCVAELYLDWRDSCSVRGCTRGKAVRVWFCEHWGQLILSICVRRLSLHLERKENFSVLDICLPLRGSFIGSVENELRCWRCMQEIASYILVIRLLAP